MADLIAPRELSNFLLNECKERGEILTNLKLQKLIYYSQAWWLALKSKELFSEDLEAWVHGPVLPSQYFRFNEYRWRPIELEVETPPVPGDIRAHLNEIVDVFGSETGVALELMTHREKPWLEARGNLPPDAVSRSPISKEMMRDFYRQMK